MPLVLVAIVAALVLIVLVVVAVRRRQPDTVDSFRRQIDALGPEARRPVVDQVQRIEDDERADGDDAEGEPRDGT